MIANRLGDYLEHMRQAASDALVFVEGLSKEEFVDDKRTQQAVIMSLVIIGEAATKIMDRFPEFAAQNTQTPWRSSAGCVTGSLMVISTSIWMSFGKQFRLPCLSY